MSLYANASPWLSLKEERFLFDEVLVHTRYNDLSEIEQETEEKPQILTEDPTINVCPISHCVLTMQEQLGLSALEHCGLVEVDPFDFTKKAIEQWTKDLLSYCLVTTPPYESLVQKRVAVQKFLHTSQRKALSLHKKAKASSGSSASGVPVVVRLSVLTLFPLIESLSGIKDANYQHLCSQVLEIVIGVIQTAGPLALKPESADCIDAFKKFISNLLDSYEYKIDTTDKSRAVALVALALSRGGASNLLLILDCLFKIYKTSNVSTELPLDIGCFLQQLHEYNKNSEAPLSKESSYLETWPLSLLSREDSKSELNPLSSSLAVDGKYLYVYKQSPHVIYKIGSGKSNSVQGHVYSTSSSLPCDDTAGAAGRLCLVGNKLYFQFLEKPKEPEEAANEMVVETEPKDDKPQPVVVIVFNTRTLHEETRLYLRTAASSPSDCRILSDGRLLYLLSRKKATKSETFSKPDASPSLREQLMNLTSDERILQDLQKLSNDQFQEVIDSGDSISEESEEYESSEEDESRLIAYEQLRSVLCREKKKKQKSSKQLPQGEGGHFMVEVYDTSAPLEGSELIPLRCFDLRGPEISVSDKGAKQYDLPLLSSSFETSEFYTNGHHLVVLLASSHFGGSYDFSRGKIFSMVDGSFLSEQTIQPIPRDFSVAYCPISDQIWSHSLSSQSVSTWANLGVAPHYKDGVASKLEFAPFTPESFLSRADLPRDFKKPFYTMDSIIIVLSNMDRLARQHQMYRRYSIVDSNTPSNGVEHCFTIDSSPEVFGLFRSVMEHALEILQRSPLEKSESMAYLIASCLRLLKINIHDFLVSGGVAKSKGNKQFDAAISGVKDMLLKFIEFDLPIPQVSTIIKREAVSAFVVGFLLFFRRSADQIQFLSSLFVDTRETNSTLLNALLDALASWPFVSNLLRDDKSDMDEPEKTQTKRDPTLGVPVNAEAKGFVDLLIDFVVHEAKKKASVKSSDKRDPPPDVTPAVRLLLALQRSIVGNAFGQGFLFAYAVSIFDKCTLLLDYLKDSHKALLARDEKGTCTFDTLLQDSVLGSVLQALVIAFHRREFNKKLDFSSTMLPLIIRLGQSLDAINNQLASAKSANKKYLGRSHTRKEQKFVVETKHPYPRGKNQLKETISIPGASALSLHFDPRSITSNSGSDILQLFLTPTLEQPMMKEGSPVYFSGANFPFTNLIVPGETVTFIFTSNTHPEPGSSTRWGFRCVVSELVPASSLHPLFSQWSLDLECMLVLLGSKCAASLVSGDPLGDAEKNAETWLSSGLFGGGLEEMASDHDHEAMKWLQLFVEDVDSAPHQFWIWLKQINPFRPKLMQPRSAKPIERAERYAISVMLKHLGLVAEAKSVLQKLSAAEQVPADVRAKFSLLARQAWQQVGQWIHQRSQIEGDWQLAVTEGQGMEFFDSFKEAPQRLAELCAVKDIEFDLMEEGETIKNLYTKLKAEIEAYNSSDSKTLPNPYDIISRPVVERLKLLLLKVAPSCGSVQHPSAQSANPFSEKVDPSAITRLRGSLELRTLNSEYGDFQASSSHPLSQSMTLPSTIGAKERAKEKVKDGEAFSQRVGELRSWINSYHRWKSWQDGGLLLNTKHKHEQTSNSQTPVQAITSFTTVSADGLTPKDWEGILRAQHSRASSRLQGIKYYHELLKLSSFGAVLHQVLGSIGDPIKGGGHYLLGISSCGHSLSVKVTNAFSSFFQTMISIVGNSSHDSLTRQLAMGICGLAFTDYDVHLLQVANVFPTLSSILSNKAIAGASLASSQGEPMDQEEPNLADSMKEKIRISDEERKKLEARRQANLRASAWTSFRLLAMQCTNWSQRGESNLHDNSAVHQLQSQVFDLMCSELKRLSSGLKKQKGPETACSVSEEDDKQCYQLLSLLFVLGSASSVRLKSLSNSKNLQSLISMLGTNAAPRSQRLVLRLCRRLLPVQSPETIEELANVLFNEMGSLIVNDKLLSNSAEAAKGPQAMDVEPEPEKKADNATSESDSDSELPKNKDKPFSVFLHQWLAGEKRLLETCSKTLGPNSVGSGTSSNPKLSSLLSEMNVKGSVLLKTGTRDQCTRLAYALAEQGGTVSLMEAAKEKEVEAKSSDSPNEDQSAHWPLFWINGHAASSLLSEHLSLLRSLIQIPEWRDKLEKKLSANLALLPTAVAELQKDPERISVNYPHILASLSLLGGFQETVRVGAAVKVKGDSGDNQAGTIVSYNAGDAKVDVIFATDEEPKPVHRVPLDSVTPLPEVLIPRDLLDSLARTSLKALLSVITKKASSSSWLLSEIKVQALSVLQGMLSSAESASLLLRDGESSEKLALLFELANEFKSLPNTDLFSKSQRDLAHRLQNVLTTPLSLASSWSRSPMVAVLPHLPFNKKADVLPTTFQVSKVPGVIFSGKDKRVVEFVAVKSSSRARVPGSFARLSSSSRDRQTEVVVTGNVPVATDIDYYFEITIEKADSSSFISVGLTPEANLNAVVWDVGSYRYQANGQKRRGAGRQEPYGSYFRSKNTVGVGWNPDTKTIYFTRDGIDLGSAFPGAFNPGERFLPAIGLGKGVKLKVNFGQEPFRFFLKPDSELDAEVLAAKQKEAEKALAAELERQKQAAAEARARKIEEAQSLTCMGFTLTQAIKAIEATGDNGERAVNWLVENMDRIEEDPEAQEEVEEPAQQNAGPEVEESKSEDVDEIIDGPPENGYKDKYSSQFIMEKCCAFEPVKEKGPQKPSIPAGWENHIIPEMKILMEKDGYQQYEILPFIQEMKNKLAEDLEDEAIKMYRHVVGQDPNPIYRMKQAVEETEAPLKIEQIRIGGRYSVKEFSVDSAGSRVQKHWTKDMNFTLGQTGTARAIEHKSELVLLSFYDPENARMEEWWYPISALSRPSHKQDVNYTLLWSDLETPIDDIRKQDFDAKTKLACVYARRLLLLLLKHVPLTLDDKSPVGVVKMLNLASYENLSAPAVLASAFPLLAQRNSTFYRKSLSPSAQTQVEEGGMELFKERLKDLYASLKSMEEVNNLTIVLQDACTSSLIESLKLHKKSTPMELDKTKIGATTPFEIKGATSLLLLFDRTCNFPSTSSAELTLFSNEQCTDVVKTITDMRSLTPLLVPHGKIWVRFTAKADQANCKYKFLAIPLSPSFPMARWTFEFLLNYCLDTELDLSTLFHVCLDFIYSCPAPSVTKEAIFILLSQTIYRLRRRPDKAKILAQFPFKRVKKLQQEAQNLYDFETRQGSLLSTYLQSLIDFIVACKMYTQPRKVTKIVRTTSPTKEAPTAEDKKEKTEEDDLTLVAIALYNAIQKDTGVEEEAEKPAEETKATPPEAKEPKMPAEVKKGSSSISGSDSDSDSNNEGVQENVAYFGEKYGLVYEDEDEDDEEDDDEAAFARAIEESLKTASAAVAKKPTDEKRALTEPTEEKIERPKPEEPKDEKRAELILPPQFDRDDLGDLYAEEDETLREALALSLQTADNDEAKDSDAAIKESNVKAATANTTAAATTTSTTLTKSTTSTASASAASFTTTAPSPFSFRTPGSDPVAPFAQLLNSSLGLATTTSLQPPTVTTAISSAPAPPAVKMKKGAPAWLTDLIDVTNYLEFFAVTAAKRGKQIAIDKYQKSSFQKIVLQAWTEVKKETIKDCLVVITNIPTVEESKRNDLIWLLQDEIENHASVVPDSIFLSIDRSTKETKSWCVVELRCKDSVNTLCTKLPKSKFKLPSQWKTQAKKGDEMEKEGDAELPADVLPSSSADSKDSPAPKNEGKLIATTFKSLEEQGDEHVKEYLRYFLSEGTPDSAPAPLTPICLQMVKEIFVRFAGSDTGALGSEDFDKLQMVCIGEPFGQENYAEICSTYPDNIKTVSRQVRKPLRTPNEMEVEEPKAPSDLGKGKEKARPEELDETEEVQYVTEEIQVIGLNLDGFIKMWAKQCQKHDPSDTWSEFINLGYDLHMQKNHYPTFEEALTVVFPTNNTDNLRGIDIMALDQEIVKSADLLFSNIPELKTPLQLQHSQIMPLSNPLEYTNVDCRILRLRFEIIKQFNSLLLKTLPLINLEGHGMLSKYMFFCRSLIFHSVKMEFFDTILDKTSVKTAQPKVAINRLKMADTTEKRDPKQQITTEWLLNNTSFGIAFSQLRATNPESFRQRKPTGTEPHFSLLVDFPGENVEGEAGPYRQFFTDISKELQQSGLLPLFVPCPNAQAKHGANRDKFVCTPSTNSRLNMKMYRFVGQLMGMAIRTGVMLTLDLPSFVWKPLVGVPNTLADLKDIDHSFYYGVMEFLYGCTKDQFDEALFDEKFQVTLSDMTKRALVPGGDKVKLTFDNKTEYLRLAEKARLEEAKHQVNAIRQGLADVVPLPLLNLCTPEDMEVSVCGRPTIDVKLLKRHTEYSGVSPTSPHVIYFWQVLQSFDQEQRRAFVRFAWAQERLPTDDLAFTRRNTRMLIKPYSGTANPDKAFPKADTCFFNLMLPEYTTPNNLRTQLLTAIYTDADSMNADNPQDEESASSLRQPPSGFGFGDYF